MVAEKEEKFDLDKLLGREAVIVKANAFPKSSHDCSTPRDGIRIVRFQRGWELILYAEEKEESGNLTTRVVSYGPCTFCPICGQNLNTAPNSEYLIGKEVWIDDQIRNSGLDPLIKES